MILDLPKIGSVRFDDNLTDEQFNAQLQALSQKYGFEVPRGQLTTGEMASRAFTRGRKQLGSVFGDIIPAMAGQALGFEDYAKQQLEEAAETQRELATTYEPQYRSLEDVKGISDAPGFALETIIEQIPNIATSLFPGMGAGVVAARTAATSLGKQLTLQAAERGLAGKAAQEFVEQGLKQAAPRIAAQAGVAQNAGIFLGSYAQNAPEVFQNIYEATGQMDVGTAMIFGSAAAALDSVLPATLARQLTGPVRVGVIEKVLEKSGMDRGLIRSTTAGLLKGVGGEGLTEGAQEAISISAERFVAENPQIFESKDWNRIMEASVRGAVAGGGFGGVGGGVQGLRQKAERGRQMADAMERRGQRQEAARLRREVADAEAQIAEIEAGRTQMELPGLETGPYASMLPTERALKAAADAKNKLTGKQIEMFDAEGNLTTAVQKAANKDEKRAAIQAREQDKREATELRAAQDRLRKLVSGTQMTLPGMSAEEIKAAEAQQAAVQAQVAETGQGDLFAGMPPARAAEEAVAEPTVVERKEPIAPEQVSTKIDDTVLKSLGVGPTALLRKNKILDGRDITNPEDAAEVRRVLEAYAENRSAPIREKIEAYLNRPEFQAAEGVDRGERVTTEPIVGAGEPSVSSVGEPGGVLAPAGAAEQTVEAGVGTTGLPAVRPDLGEEGVERPLGKKAQADVRKTEEKAEVATKEQANFVSETDQNTSALLNTTLRDAMRAANLPDDAIDAEDFIGTEAHNMLRLPPLINRFLDLRETLAIPAEKTSQAKAQRAKNLQELNVLKKGIAKSSPEVADFLDGMSTLPTPDQRNQILSQFNKQGRESFAPVAAEKIAKAKAGMEAPAKAAPAKKEITDEELDALANDFNARFMTKTGKRLFLPKFVGASFNEEQRALAQSGDLRGLVNNLAENTTNAGVRRVLKRIKGLNLKTKLIAGNPEGPIGKRVSKGIAYHSGDLGYGSDTTLGRMVGGRNTGHFGTGVYFVSNPENISNLLRENRPIESVDLSGYHLLRPSIEFEAETLHEGLKKINSLTSNDIDLNSLEAQQEIRKAAYNVYLATDRSSSEGEINRAIKEAIQEARLLLPRYRFESNYVDSASTRVIKKLGYEGIDVRHLPMYDNTTFGTVVYTDKFLPRNKAGSYDPRTDTIVINPELGMSEHAAVHELVHAAISHVLRNPDIKLTQEFTKFFETLQNQLGAAYGGQDIQEFASELVSNPEFQALLKDMKAPRSGSWFDKFVQAIAEFFGFRKGETGYDAGMRFVMNALDISGDVEAHPADKLFLGLGPSVTSGFGTVGKIGQAMPRLAGNTVEATRNYLSNAPRGATSLAMGLLRLDNINTIYGKELPSIQTLLDALEKRNGNQEQRIKTINDNYKQFIKIAKAKPQAMDRMNKMAYESRLQQVDPLGPAPTAPSQIAAYNTLKATFDSLPKDVQGVYRTIRNSYESAINEYEQMLLSSVTPSLAAKLKLEFQTRKRQAAYIPFLRRGEFWVEYTGEDGERWASAFESVRERERFVGQELKRRGITDARLYENIQNARFQQGTVPPTSFIGRVMNDLTQQGANQQQLDSVYQAYLALFPGQSISKNFMKADNVRGMEQDIVRGYGETMIKWARRLSNSEYTPQIDRAIQGIVAESEQASDPNARVAAQNIVNQQQFLHNPTYGSLVTAATTFSYFNYIAGNISSALINLSTLPMFSYPILGAKFGFDKAASAMLSASKTATNYILNNKIDGRYKDLFDVLNDHAQLSHTLAREVLEGQRQTTAEFTGLKAKVMDGLSIPFAATEKLNRGATAIAAYDLAMSSGMSKDAAIQYALRTVKDINTSGLSATAPSWMQHPLGRVFFTFKSFVWNSAFIMARSFHQAFKGESPAVRREARRQFLGISGMAFTLAGAKGLPFMGAASVLAEMLHTLFGDDDEPFDFQTEMREFFGDAMYKGAINYALNLEVANRIGVAQDLLFRDDPRGIAEDGYVLTAMKQAFGPAGSYFWGAERGIRAMAEGNVMRGVESLLPSFIRNGLKGGRYMTEGALTLKGDPIDEDISAYNSLMQVLGFSPADLSTKYEETSAAKGYEREVMARRKRLLNKFDMARTAGDVDLMQEVRGEINEFNASRTDPKARISVDTLRKSEAARRAAERNMINGVKFNKGLKSEIEAKFFEDEED